MLPLIEWPSSGRATRGILLDTHTLLWFKAGMRLQMEAKIAIAEAIEARAIFLSQMFLWELGLATLKAKTETRPNLGGLTVEQYYREANARYAVRFIQLSDEIALEAASVTALYGYGDPGDCFPIATAHVENLALVTRDAKIIEFANRRPDYLTVIPC